MRSIDELLNELSASPDQFTRGKVPADSELDSSVGQCVITNETRGRVETVRIRPEDYV